MNQRTKFPALLLQMVAAWTLWPAHAVAQTSASAWLPSQTQVESVMQAQPAVLAAAARVQAASATQQALVAGSHGYELSTGLQRRRVTDEMRRYHEWEVQVSRAIRLPGKAQLDQEIGDGTHRVAVLRLADAEHQTARRLLDAWMGWLRSTVVAEEMQAQDLLLAREQQALARRLAVGDVAQRDKDLLDAERALLAAQVIGARDAARSARHALVSEFPQIEVPAQLPSLPDPAPLPDGAQRWRERIVQESAEIGIAAGEASRLAKLAQRAHADRTPDPTLGVRFMSDRGGAERTAGVVLTVPFGTSYRNALARGESAHAVAAEAEAAGVRRAVEQGAWAAVQAAESKLAQWQSFTHALAAQQAASQRTRRAWELGEAPLSEHLLAQRNLRQTQLAEAQSRMDALQAGLLVRIDAHALWHSHSAPADPER